MPSDPLADDATRVAQQQQKQSAPSNAAAPAASSSVSEKSGGAVPSDPLADAAPRVPLPTPRSMFPEVIELYGDDDDEEEEEQRLQRKRERRALNELRQKEKKEREAERRLAALQNSGERVLGLGEKRRRRESLQFAAQNSSFGAGGGLSLLLDHDEEDGDLVHYSPKTPVARAVPEVTPSLRKLGYQLVDGTEFYLYPYDDVLRLADVVDCPPSLWVKERHEFRAFTRNKEGFLSGGVVLVLFTGLDDPSHPGFRVSSWISFNRATGLAQSALGVRLNKYYDDAGSSFMRNIRDLASTSPNQSSKTGKRSRVKAVKARKHLKADSPTWDIEKIVSRQSQGGMLQYRVRYVGYGPEQDMWYDEQDLRATASEAVDAFEDNLAREKQQKQQQKQQAKQKKKRKGVQ